MPPAWGNAYGSNPADLFRALNLTREEGDHLLSVVDLEPYRTGGDEHA